MVFNSFTFALFLPIVLAIYYLLPFRGQNLWLLAAGLVFYGWRGWRRRGSGSSRGVVTPLGR